MNIVKPGKISGNIAAPGSKSHMQRVVALACLAHTPTTILNPSLCDDSKSCLEIAEVFGALVQFQEGKILITPKAQPLGGEVSCGESGTAIRIFSALAALFDQRIVLNAKKTLLTRPMDMIAESLSGLGASCLLNGGCPPITIKGPIKGGTIEIDGSVTSQFLSGLLIALPCAPNDSQIKVRNLKSIPYVELTIECIKQFGGYIDHDDAFKIFTIPGRQHYTGICTTIEGDWSGASFMLVAGAIGGRIEVEHLAQNSMQSDRAIIEALRRANADVEITSSSVQVSANALSAFEFDTTNCPDLFPPLVALASACSGTSKIRGVHRLIHKESNRAETLRSEFMSLGISVSINNDEMLVTGGNIHGGEIFSHNDHRIAMACAVASLKSSEPVFIKESSCVSKSYPSFFQDLESIRSKQ